MKKEILKELKEKLEKEKENIKKELESFAKKDAKLGEDWDTKYPHFGEGIGSQRSEEAADEVEEYLNLLPIEANLELRLRAIQAALEKIERGTYGICEKCKKEIPLERLRAYPEAKFCLQCQK